MVPAYTELLSLPLKSAVDWRLAILLILGVVPGAQVGAALTVRTAERRRLRLAVGVFLALVAVVYFVTEPRALLAL